MDWKQIETKWAAMARRISADAACGEINDSAPLERRAGKDEATRNVIAKQIDVVRSEATKKRDTVSTG